MIYLNSVNGFQHHDHYAYYTYDYATITIRYFNKMIRIKVSRNHFCHHENWPRNCPMSLSQFNMLGTIVILENGSNLSHNFQFSAESRFKFLSHSLSCKAPLSIDHLASHASPNSTLPNYQSTSNINQPHHSKQSLNQ